MRTLSACLHLPRCAGAPALVGFLGALLLLAACENSPSGDGGKTVVQGGTPPAGRMETPLPGATASAPQPPPGMTVPQDEPQLVMPPGTGESVIVSGATRALPPSMAGARTRVGILLPLSGPRRDVGRSLLDAALLALQDVADDDFLLMPFDTGGTDAGAQTAIRDALDNRVQLVLGPLFSPSVAAAAPAAKSAGVNMIAFSNNRIVADDGVYLTGLLPEAQIDRVVRFAATRGTRRIAALLPSGAFGDRVQAALRETANGLGLDVVRVGFFTGDPAQTATAVRAISDYDRRKAALKAQIRAVEGETDEVSRRTLARLERLETFGPLPYDALVVAASGTKLTEVAAQLSNFDVDTNQVRLLGIASWSESGVGREPALVGAWYAGVPATASAEFTRNFTAMYETGPHPLAVDAYDVAALSAILAASSRGNPGGTPAEPAEPPEPAVPAGTAGDPVPGTAGNPVPDDPAAGVPAPAPYSGGPYSKASLTRESGFAGVSGLFRFGPGGLPERVLEVREVTPDGSKVVDPAPKSFSVLTN